MKQGIRRLLEKRVYLFGAVLLTMLLILVRRFFYLQSLNDSPLSVKNGNFLPEPHTDFIMAVAGEELGFWGCLVILLLLALIVTECIRIGLGLTLPFVSYGLTSLVSLYIGLGLVLNVGLQRNEPLY